MMSYTTLMEYSRLDYLRKHFVKGEYGIHFVHPGGSVRKKLKKYGLIKMIHVKGYRGAKGSALSARGEKMLAHLDKHGLDKIKEEFFDARDSRKL